MATAYIYNHTARKVMAGENPATDTYKVMLLNSTAVAAFDATDTLLDEVSATGSNEVYGNGWTQGGETISNISIDTVTTNDAKMVGDDVYKLVSTGNLGPYHGYVVYNDSSSGDAPIVLVDIEADETTLDGSILRIDFSTNGIINATVA